MNESVTEVEAPESGNHTKLGYVIREPTESRAWDKDAEVVPGFGLRARVIIVEAGGRMYLSCMGISEKCSSKASLMGR
jgi:hypothetical protein